MLFTNSVVNQLTLHLATYFWQLDRQWTPRLLIAGVCRFDRRDVPRPVPGCKLVGTRACDGLGLVVLLRRSGRRGRCCRLLGLSPPPASVAIGAFVFVVPGARRLAYGLYVVPFNTVTYDIGDEHEANTGRPQQGLVASFMFIGLQVGSGLVSAAGGLRSSGSSTSPRACRWSRCRRTRCARWRGSSPALILVAGAAMAWLVGRFEVSTEKQAAIRAKLARLRAAARAQSSRRKSAAPAP